MPPPVEPERDLQIVEPATSTISTVPTEILRNIFLQARPELPSSIRVHRSSPTAWLAGSQSMLPSTLCRVSTKWNQIIMNLPVLWTFLYIDFGKQLLDDQT